MARDGKAKEKKDRLEMTQKIHAWLTEEKKDVRFGQWSTKEVRLLARPSRSTALGWPGLERQSQHRGRQPPVHPTDLEWDCPRLALSLAQRAGPQVELLNEYNLLTGKPGIYLVNMSETDFLRCVCQKLRNCHPPAKAPELPAATGHVRPVAPAALLSSGASDARGCAPGGLSSMDGQSQLRVTMHAGIGIRAHAAQRTRETACIAPAPPFFLTFPLGLVRLAGRRTSGSRSSRPGSMSRGQASG